MVKSSLSLIYPLLVLLRPPAVVLVDLRTLSRHRGIGGNQRRISLRSNRSEIGSSVGRDSETSDVPPRRCELANSSGEGRGRVYPSRSRFCLSTLWTAFAIFPGMLLLFVLSQSSIFLSRSFARRLERSPSGRAAIAVRIPSEIGAGRFFFGVDWAEPGQSLRTSSRQNSIRLP